MTQKQLPKDCRHCLYSVGDYCLKINRHTPSKICEHFELAILCENCTKYPTCTSEWRDYGSILDISPCINLPDEENTPAINTMHNEQQNNDERFTVVELEDGSFAVYDMEASEKTKEVCIFRPRAHPFAKQAAEGLRDKMQAWSMANITIQPIDKLKPQRAPLVKGKFYEAPPPTLTVDEKRRYLSEIFRSPNFSDCDKFKALQEDNRMLAMFNLGNGKEPK